jgi:hypothetical protein
LADEYAKIINALLSNEYYLAKCKKDTFAQLISAYDELTEHVKSESHSANGEATPENKALGEATKAFNDLETKFSRVTTDKFNLKTHETQLMCDLEEKKAAKIETLLEADSIKPMVTFDSGEFSIEFRNSKNGFVVLTIPVKQSVGAEVVA